MGIESATYISQLVATNPVGGVDDYATADDHLRLIKDVLQGQFPNFTADAVNVTPAELNILDGVTAVPADLELLSGAEAAGLTAAEVQYLIGVTSLIQDQLDSKPPNTREVIAGIAIAGGGDLSADRTFDFDGTNLGASGGLDMTDELFLYDIGAVGYFKADFTAINALLIHDDLAGALAAEHIDWAVTGSELIHADRLTDSDIDHDSTGGYDADDHVAHSGIDMIAGTGLGGGGTIEQDRTFNLDLSGEAAFTPPIAETDEFLIDDNGTYKRVTYQDLATPLSNQSGAAYELVIGDANKVVTMSHGTANVLTIPANISVAFPIGTMITIVQLDVGQTTIALTTDLLRAPQGVGIREQYGVASIIKLTANSWVLSGLLE